MSSKSNLLNKAGHYFLDRYTSLGDLDFHRKSIARLSELVIDQDKLEFENKELEEFTYGYCAGLRVLNGFLFAGATTLGAYFSSPATIFFGLAIAQSCSFITNDIIRCKRRDWDCRNYYLGGGTSNYLNFVADNPAQEGDNFFESN